MLSEYAQFVQSIFPSIDPSLSRQLLAHARREGFVDQEYFANQLGDKLCQGDIVDGIDWPYQREDGRFGRKRIAGQLLSHSCDVDNAEWLTFAACLPFDKSAGNAAEVRRQQITELYYVAPYGTKSARVVDLAQVISLRTGWIIQEVAAARILRTDALSPIGYWHFLAKLTIHFMRPQAADEVRLPSAPSLPQRVRYAGAETLGLLRYAILGHS